jgi:hypothetical protein
VHTVMESTESLVVAIKKIRLEENSNKTKYMVTSRDQNAGSHITEIDNSSSEKR